VNRRQFSNCDFAYWLQGAIEIDGLKGFNETQITLIRRRLNDIPKKDAFSGTVWLLLATCEPQIAFDKINQELQKKFIHDIDPSYDGDQAYFYDVHDGKIGDQA